MFCEHCGALVGLTRDKLARNFCPDCHWSKHVMFGTVAEPACGALMQPVRITDTHIVHRCLGCAHRMRSPLDTDNWATRTDDGICLRACDLVSYGR